MRFLIIGLGSMGKRRIRCLQALGHQEILGCDVREDRREEATRLYGIATVASLDDVPTTTVDAIIISTPPDKHNPFIKFAIERVTPAFIEASVILEGLEEILATSQEKGVPLFPSCTLRFHPAIADIKRIVTSGAYGRMTNFSYHCGQYLPDWHPWEDIRDFYVSRKETGACREIVPFELTWIVDILGDPDEVTGFYGKTMEMGVDIDDTYAMTLKFKKGFGTIVVDAVARSAIRSLILNLEHAQITWRWDQPYVTVYEAMSQRSIVYNQRQSKAEAGYNINIGERMYIDETAAFIQALNGTAQFPNSLSEDIRILRLLYGFEKRAGERS
jgi:predicted dehydrogenase